MENKPEYITYDNIIIKVDSILDVEKTDTPSGGKPHMIVNLSSGRSIDTEFPTEAAREKRYQDFMNLFEPADWEIKPEDAGVETKSAE